MFPRRVRSLGPWPAVLVAVALALLGNLAGATKTDLASVPLETSSATLVKPNILVILDDSGSMSYTYLPDWASASSLCAYILAGTNSAIGTCDATRTTEANKLAQNSAVNGVYYDPAVTYTPPVAFDGTAYPSMTAANSTNWTKVPVDGYGVQSTSTVNLASSSPVYYYFGAGEYCSAPNLRSCAAQTTASASYPYPALLRWCTTTALTSCQASRIETAPTGGSTYLYPRYPGATTSSGTTVPGTTYAVTIAAATTSYVLPGTAARAATRTDCVTNASTCTYAEEKTNFANWYAYYRTRMQTMKTASSQALIDLGTSYRLGFMSINNNTGTDFLDIGDITTGSGGQKSGFYSKLFAAKPSSTTPLKKALFTAGRYYAGKLSSINSVSASDPMQYACQRNYTILSTDGYWNESTTPTRIDGSTAIGDTDSSEVRPYLDGKAQSNTLADIAEYYYTTDIRSATFSNTTNRSTGVDVASNSYATGQQRMYTFTLGLGASGYMQYDSNYANATSGDYYDVANGTAASSTTMANGVCIWQSSGACTWPAPSNNTQTGIDDLWHAAVNGRGTYYSATNPTELKAGLTDFVNAVSAANGSSASATASTPNLSATSDNFLFATSYCSAKWFGELARYALDASTGDIASSPTWAESGAGSDCTSASPTLSTTPLLDRLTWSDRKIYTADASTGALIDFSWDTLGSAQSYFKVAALTDLSQMCASGSTCLPTTAQVDSSVAGTTTGAGGLNLVNYLRGDRSNEGTNAQAYYFKRTHVLGDIVNGQAVYVQKAGNSFTDAGYADYKSSTASRAGMVYVGANDGMLHAFNATTGTEAWAFVPSMVLPTLHKLADKNYASRHVNFLDGPLAQAEAYFGGAWHTMLVGGMGQGGRGFYALDVTTPSSPKVLWQFTYDTSAGSGYVKDEDLGYSYATPLVTKLSDGTWVVLVTSGYNNISPGSGHGIVYVLNAATGAVIKKIDNGMGSSSGAVTGCASSPCPSGLARISAWVDSATNNTATYLYGGDLLGNVWRFDLTKLTSAGGTVPVQLLATLFDSNGVRQPITAAPELAEVSSQHMVYIGTGQYLGATDISTTQQQTIYAIKDKAPTVTSSATTPIYANPRYNTCSTSVMTNCFVQQVLTDSGSVRTVSNSLSTAPDVSLINGWFADLPQTGERINTDLYLASGIVVAVSNIPTTSGACATGGSSYLNYLDYASGGAVNSSNEVGSLLSSTALASTATVIQTTTGTIRAILSLSNGTLVEKTIGMAATQSSRRLSWRELILGQ